MLVPKDMYHGDRVDGIWDPSIMTRNPYHGYSTKWGPPGRESRSVGGHITPMFPLVYGS